VFDVVLQIGILLAQPAILAALIGTATDERTLRLIHVLVNLWF
jgi:hypothetical protein